MISTKINIQEADPTEKVIINEIVEIHLDTFQGFFLTFLGRGFLKQLYQGFCSFNKAHLLVAFDDNKMPIGFLAYSEDISGFYKYLIKKKLFPFAWYSFCAFFRKPSAIVRLLRAFLKPGESKRNENYIELASIGVKKQIKSSGVGSKLIDELKSLVDFNKFKYISLDTDAENNEAVNLFYLKQGFTLHRTFVTAEGRKMNEYRYTDKEVMQ